MTNQIQQAYFELLSNPCPKCDVQPFAKFESLRDHVRREHEHFYCDLCVANLKIFTFERRCYNRQQLGIHRRVGDADNTSHRGHPLCEYCDVRYLDRDELFRHLRREHFFCHFCDAEGTNQFYRWVFVFWPFVCVEQDNTFKIQDFLICINVLQNWFHVCQQFLNIVFVSWRLSL